MIFFFLKIGANLKTENLLPNIFLKVGPQWKHTQILHVIIIYLEVLSIFLNKFTQFLVFFLPFFLEVYRLHIKLCLFFFLSFFLDYWARYPSLNVKD